MKKLMLIMILCLAPLSSQAIIELRGGYGQNTFDDDTYGGSDMKTMRGFNADLIIKPPLITNFGFGLRYESMSFDLGSTADVDMDRLSALVNYRVIDTGLYLGFIGTVGIKSEAEMEIGGQTLTYDGNLNFSLGVEGGLKLGLITLGGEIGKLFAEFDAPSGSGNSDLDLSSLYLKAIIGFGF